MKAKAADDPLRSKLLTLLALCYGDRGKVADEVTEITKLEEAMAANPRCNLSRVTYGLRRAEEHPYGQPVKPGEFDFLAEIERAITRAAVDKRDDRDARVRLAEDIIDDAIPVTWSFFLDARGYALFKRGDLRGSKAILFDCVRRDPVFSSAYLHLGEWYLQRFIDSRLSDNGAAQLSETFFKVAKRLEGELETRILRKVNEGEHRLAAAKAQRPLN